MTRPVQIFDQNRIYKKDENGNTLPSKLVKSNFRNGTFHQFGLDIEEDENGYSSYSTAIIELKDGSVVNQPIHLFEFKDKV